MKNELHWVQALRGVAALMVLFFHMTPHWDSVSSLQPFSILTRWGFAGVDIFFVLSGFVVFRSAQRHVPAHGWWPFMKKRLLRVYLGYWPVLLVIALTTVYVYEENLPDVQKMVFSTLLLYPNIWDNWLPPAWSLSHEIYFYLWISLIALLPHRWQIKAIFSVMAVLIAWGCLWLLIDSFEVAEGRQPLRYVLTGLGLEFLAGALLAHAHEKAWPLFQRTISTSALSIVVMAAGLSLGMTSPFFDRVEVMRAISFGLVGVGALLLALTLEGTRFKPPFWLIALGNCSYSLYLLHSFLLDASGRIRFRNEIYDPEALLAFMLALPVVIIAISWLWYRLVEKPLMKAAL